MKKSLLALGLILLVCAPLAGRAQETTLVALDVSVPTDLPPEIPPPVVGPVIKVLTFNTWEIVSAKMRNERAAAIGKRIAELDPDIIAIQEMFEAKHRDIFLQSLADHGYRPAANKYFLRLYGSGILFLSKFPVLSVTFEPYRVNSPWYDIERIGGKGIAHLLLDTPHGRLDFFITHALSRTPAIFDAQGNFIPGDPKQTDRILQMYQIDRFVRAHRSPRGRSVIAAGDFNVSPEMLEYQFLIALTGFESSFEILNPGQNPSTFDEKNNMWVPDDFSRIDHILFKNYAGPDGFWLNPVRSRVEMDGKFVGPDGKEYNYSDHYGIYTEFEVTQNPALAPPSPEGRVRGTNACAACAEAAGAGAEIALTPENYPAWRDYALGVMGEAYWRKDRTNPLVIPMAELLTSPPSAAGRVELDDRAQKELKKRGCPDDCGREAKAADRPGDESWTRRLQSFSPWN